MKVLVWMGAFFCLDMSSSQNSSQLPENDLWTMQALQLQRGLNNLHGMPGFGYSIKVQVGSPPQDFNVLIDTGSSNFALAATPHPHISKYFSTAKSNTYLGSSQSVSVPYTQGKWSGELGRDVVRIPSLGNVSVFANIAFITSSQNFFVNDSTWQGILGLAYSHLSLPDPSVEPFFDSLAHQTNVSQLFTLQLCSTVESEKAVDADIGGNLNIGRLDEKQYTPPIHYVNIHKEDYYQVVISDIYIGNISLSMDCKEYNFDKTIVDSGTTDIRLPYKVFSRVVDLIKLKISDHDLKIPALFWEGLDTMCWQEGFTPWQSFPALSIFLAQSKNSSFRLTIPPHQYLRVANKEENVATFGKICYKFSMSKSDSGTVLGAVFLQGFFVVFDRQNRRLGFAVTSCPPRSPRTMPALLGTPRQFHGADFDDCAYNRVVYDQKPLLIAAYVISSLCLLIMLPFLYVLCCRGRSSKPQRHNDLDNLPENELFVR